MARLILRDLIKGGSWALTVEQDDILVGRSRDAEVSIRDRSVSKQHCRIERRNRAYHFKDLGSRNGTYINELRTRGGPLEDGDELRVGNFAIIFYANDDGGPAPEASGAAASQQSPAGDLHGAELIEPSPFDAVDFDDGEDLDATLLAVDRPGEPVSESIDPAPTKEDASTAPERLVNVTPPESEAPEVPLDALADDTIPAKPPAAPKKAFTPKVAGTSARASDPPKSGRAAADTSTSPGPRRGGQTKPEREREPRKKHARSRASSSDLDFEDLEERPAGRRVSRPRGHSSQVLWIVGLTALLGGVALGILIGRNSRSGLPPADGNSSKTKKTTTTQAARSKASATTQRDKREGSAATKKTPSTSPSTTRRETTSQPTTPASDAGSGTARRLANVRADLSRSEISQRALVRLFLDVLGRSPTSKEIDEYLPLPPDQRWSRVRYLAKQELTTPSLSTLPGVFHAFLGRAPTPAEEEALLGLANGNADKLGEIIAGSEYYASTEHERSRSQRQRARCLWVDIFDEIPTAEDTSLVMKTLDRSAADIQTVVRTLIHSDKAAQASSAKAKSDPARWVDQTYRRAVLRSPKADERHHAIREVEGSDDGWQRVLLDLCLRDEYSRY